MTNTVCDPSRPADNPLGTSQCRPAVPTVFLHIPRTGGTTLNTILERVFAGRPLYCTGRDTAPHIEDCARFLELPPQQRTAFTYITGHLELSVIRSIPGRSFVFTFVRHPVERIISLYAFVKRTPGHHMHPWLAETGASLEQFVARCPWDEVQNGMTRRLAGVTQARTNDSLLLLRAIATIKRYLAFVGIQEAFDASLHCLGTLLGMRASDLGYTAQNVNPDPFAAASAMADTNALAAIRFYNALDCALYDFCLDLFAAEKRRLDEADAARR